MSSREITELELSFAIDYVEKSKDWNFEQANRLRKLARMLIEQYKLDKEKYGRKTNT